VRGLIRAPAASEICQSSEGAVSFSFTTCPPTYPIARFSHARAYAQWRSAVLADNPSTSAA
jgi:hypothetical protein